MINRISIENFKIFKDKVEFDNLGKLNLLTGINGRGKSSMLQVLTSVSQSVKERGGLGVLCLNGELATLGNARDVKNEDTSRDKEVVFEFDCDDFECRLQYKIDNENDPVLYSDGRDIMKSPGIDTKVQDLPILFFYNLIFISAERIGPQLHYGFSNDNSNIGARGEYVACALFNHKDATVSDSIIEYIPNVFPEENPENLDRSVIGQVQFWLSKMFNPTYLSVDYIESVNEYTMQYGSPDRNGRSKPTNVGFGYSYALPIVVAALLAKKDSVLIVENPEAHLHPKAQNILMSLLAIVSVTGVQVFIETHSEHIINAPRVMVAQKAFDAKDINILYFDERYESKHTSIEVLKDGRISDWPDGFFDQAEIDNDIILGL